MSHSVVLCECMMFGRDTLRTKVVKCLPQIIQSGASLSWIHTAAALISSSDESSSPSTTIQHSSLSIPSNHHNTHKFDDSDARGCEWNSSLLRCVSVRFPETSFLILFFRSAVVAAKSEMTFWSNSIHCFFCSGVRALTTKDFFVVWIANRLHIPSYEENTKETKKVIFQIVNRSSIYSYWNDESVRWLKEEGIPSLSGKSVTVAPFKYNNPRPSYFASDNVGSVCAQQSNKVETSKKNKYEWNKPKKGYNSEERKK